MTDQLEEIKKGFVENTLKELSCLRSVLTETDNKDKEVSKIEMVEKVFMAMHAICGTAPVVGFEHLVPLSRKLEIVFDQIRKGEKQFSEQINVQTLRGIDALISELSRHSESVVY
ncbi:MAG: chemotaxis protein CheA [Marinilabilia sp.]